SYFTIGETVGQPGARFADLGLQWIYTPPCVALDHWTPHSASENAPFTTVTHWSAYEWMQDRREIYCNTKRAGFLPFLDLPHHASHPLELALCLGEDEHEEANDLRSKGWRIANAAEIASTPWAYHRY